MVKNRDDSDYWGLYHIGWGATQYGTLPSTSPPSANSDFWNDTAPTNSVITLGSQNRVNGSSDNMVAYAWHDVEGYSKFGSYTGNNNADGTFIYTGFRPRMLFIKQTDGTANWNVFDTARDTHNYVSKHVIWDGSAIEYDGAAYSLDVLSNGFKIRASWGQINSGEYMYGAWGDVSFKYNNTF